MGSGYGGCERRIEVFVKIKKIRGGGGGGVSGHCTINHNVTVGLKTMSL